MPNKLTLLSTDGCHLCHQAEHLLQQLSFLYDVVDIITDDDLVALYGDKIPVLMYEGAEQALFWPFYPEQIKQYIEIYGIDQSN